MDFDSGGRHRQHRCSRVRTDVIRYGLFLCSPDDASARLLRYQPRPVVREAGSVALTLGDAICSALAGINSYYILWLDRLMQQSRAASPGPDASQERRQLQRWFSTRPKGLSSGLQDRSLLRSLSLSVASLNDNGTTLFRRHCLRRTWWRLRRSWRQAPDGACL